MIEPAGTSWPSPAFTPSRWPTLSRPFLTLPPAFLWAIAYLSFVARVVFGAAFGAAFLVVLSSAADAMAAGFFGAAFAADFGAALAGAVFASAFAAVAFGFAVEAFVGFASAGADLASLAARAASTAACLAAASSRRWRSVFASASALRTDSAALFDPSRTSMIRSTVSSWR